MQRELAAYLWDVLDAIEVIESYSRVHGMEDFLSDRFAQTAIERNFEIIGEAMKQASALYPGALGDLPELSQAIRFRDRLAHGYFSIAPVIVWESVSQDLPRLRLAVDEKLRAITSGSTGDARE